MNNKRTMKIIKYIIIVACLVSFSYYSNNALEVTVIEVESDKIQEDVRIVHLSDLHGKQFGEDNKKLIQLIKEQNPDIIAFTGDLIDSRRQDNIEESISFIEELSKLYEVYFILGNHDNSLKRRDLYSDDIDSIEGDFYYLQGDYNNIKVNNNDLSIMCFDIYTDRIESFKDEDSFKVLLNHYPQNFDNYNIYDIDLVLTGHTHGGQFDLPFVGGVYAPGQGLFPEYYKGIYEENDTYMVVSRGLGNSAFPQRLFNRPEVVVIDLKVMN